MHDNFFLPVYLEARIKVNLFGCLEFLCKEERKQKKFFKVFFLSISFLLLLCCLLNEKTRKRYTKRMSYFITYGESRGWVKRGINKLFKKSVDYEGKDKRLRDRKVQHL